MAEKVLTHIRTDIYYIIDILSKLTFIFIDIFSIYLNLIFSR